MIGTIAVRREPVTGKSLSRRLSRLFHIPRAILYAIDHHGDGNAKDLGLSIARGLGERVGIGISIDSAPGGGTRARLSWAIAGLE